MNTGFYKVSAVSFHVEVADVFKNTETILSKIQVAKDKNVQILTFPELSLTGATIGDLFYQKSIFNAIETALQRICLATAESSMLVCIGTPILFHSNVYDCVVLMQNGKILAAIPKKPILSSSTIFRAFQTENEVHKLVTICNQQVPFGMSIVELSQDLKLGVLFLDDILSLNNTISSYSQDGANIFLCLNAQPSLVGEKGTIDTLLKSESLRQHAVFVYASVSPFESSTDYVFSGYCSVIENGKILESSEPFSLEEPEIVVDIDIERCNLDRIKSKQFVKSNHEHDMISSDLTLLPLSENEITRTIARNPFIPVDKVSANKRALDILEMQSNALLNRLIHIHQTKLILGLSGGLDSTLAFLVCVRTLNKLQLPLENLICVTLPGFGTTDRTYHNTLALVKSYGCALKEISISKATLQHFEDIGHDPKVKNSTYENAQARERTQILMDLANDTHALLVGTGDLSELALGWCTYNADHMSMYSVNCDIPKTLVQFLVEYEASHAEENVSSILKDILATPISPELLPPDEKGIVQQKTENTLGPYEVHDFYLYYFLRFAFSPEKLLLLAKKAFSNKYSEEELKTWLEVFVKRFFQNQFKRSCLPDGPKVGSIGISPRGDFMMPSDASYSAFLNF